MILSTLIHHHPLRNNRSRSNSSSNYYCLSNYSNPYVSKDSATVAENLIFSKLRLIIIPGRCERPGFVYPATITTIIYKYIYISKLTGSRYSCWTVDKQLLDANQNNA